MKGLTHAGLQRARQIANHHAQVTGRRAFSAEASGERGKLYFYESIGQDWWTGEGVTAKKVAAALEDLRAQGVKALDIYVNSPGGDIFEAKAIHTNLRRFEGERVVHVDGIAASAATFIAMAGDKIITVPSATWMIHEVHSWGVGNAADFRALADVLDKENGIFAEAYSKRTGSSAEDIRQWMAAETWMNAKEALQRGFTDEVAEADTSEAAVQALAAALDHAHTTLRGPAA